MRQQIDVSLSSIPASVRCRWWRICNKLAMEAALTKSIDRNQIKVIKVISKIQNLKGEENFADQRVFTWLQHFYFWERSFKAILRQSHFGFQFPDWSDTNVVNPCATVQTEGSLCRFDWNFIYPTDGIPWTVSRKFVPLQDLVCVISLYMLI